MPRRPIVAGLAIIAAFGLASVLALWLLTRESHDAAGPAIAHEAAPPPAPLPAPVPRPAAPAAPAAPPAAPEPAPPQMSAVEVTPLFLPNRSLALGKTAALEFQARRRGSEDPAANAEITVSVLKVGERAEEALRVQEVAPGFYRAEFTPRATGRFVVAASSRGVRATSVPVVVAERADGSARR